MLKRERQARVALSSLKCLFLSLILLVAVFPNRAPAQSPAAGDSGPPTPRAYKRFFEYPVLYATNRIPQSVAGPRESYGGRADKVSYGSALITVPAAHKAGALEMPPISVLEWRLKLPRRPRNKETQFGIEAVKPLPQDEWLRATEKLGGAGDSLLIFVPGRSSFSDSALRAAQIAFDLRQKNVLLFSWPATGGGTSYIYDRESASSSERYFSEFLDLASKTSFPRINILAAGMAAPLVMSVIRDNASIMSKLDNLMLVAPDMDSDVASNLISRISRNVHVTVYSNKEDRDLKLANAFWGMPRFGAAAPEQISAGGFDFVVVEPAGDVGLRILRDMHGLLTSGQAPPQRGLKRVPVNGALGAYWLLE